MGKKDENDRSDWVDVDEVLKGEEWWYKLGWYIFFIMFYDFIVFLYLI